MLRDLRLVGLIVGLVSDTYQGISGFLRLKLFLSICTSAQEQTSHFTINVTNPPPEGCVAVHFDVRETIVLFINLLRCNHRHDDFSLLCLFGHARHLYL